MKEQMTVSFCTDAMNKETKKDKLFTYMVFGPTPTGVTIRLFAILVTDEIDLHNVTDQVRLCQ